MSWYLLLGPDRYASDCDDSLDELLRRNGLHTTKAVRLFPGCRRFPTGDTVVHVGRVPDTWGPDELMVHIWMTMAYEEWDKRE